MTTQRPSFRQSDVVILLGAGASADAGYPLAAGLTSLLIAELSTRIRSFKYVLGKLALIEPKVLDDYELLFFWMDRCRRSPALVKRLQLGGWKRFVRVWERYSECVAKVIVQLLQSRATSPWYLDCLGAFLPATGRLDIFTLNYDLAVEEACRARGIFVTTGFNDLGQWRPALFSKKSRGINLHKLHGSLDWYEVPIKTRDGHPRSYAPLITLSHRWQAAVPRHVAEPQGPRIILGPASKVQSDDPYFHLLARFHRAIQHAKVCIAIGFGWRDLHVTDRVDRCRDHGMRLLNVSLTPVPIGPGHDGGSMTSHRGVKNLPMTASQALTSPTLVPTVAKLISQGSWRRQRP